MKKALLLVSILLISVVSTACINNLAVQELNNKAMSYMEKGDYQGAIERLKSSLDLDESVFETHYNLAIAYTKAEDYAHAIESYTNALKINPNFADAYYSLAVCEENLAKDLISGIVKIDENGTIRLLTPAEIEEANEKSDNKKTKLSDADKAMVVELLNRAIEDYKTYLEKNPSAHDKKEVEDKIEKLNEMILNYSDVNEVSQ